MLPMLNEAIALNIFKIGEFIRKEQIIRKVEELIQNQSFSQERLNDLRIKKLKRLLEYSYRFSPYYRERLSGIDFNQINSFDILKNLEILTKEKLRENVENITSERPISKTYMAKTSGSTGIPLIFPKDTVTRAYHYAAMFRGHMWYGLEISDREARLWGVPVNIKDRLKIRVNDYLLNRFREAEYSLSEEILEDFHKKVLLHKPKLIMGYGKMLYEFAIFLKQTNRTLKQVELKIAKYTSEGINDEEEEVIRETFDCPVVSEYGAAETGIISFQCPHGNHHIMSDCVHVEFEKANLQSRDNRLREILITDLNNLSFPIIRYKIGDLVLKTENKCSCGLPFPLLEKIQGRASEIFSIGSKKKYHSIIFYYIMKGLTQKNKSVTQFKVIQKSPMLFCYQIKSKKKDKNIDDYIIEKTKAELGNYVEVRVEYLEHFEREHSGKLRDFIPYNIGQ